MQFEEQDYISKKLNDGVTAVGGLINDGVKIASNIFIPKENGDSNPGNQSATPSSLHADSYPAPPPKPSSVTIDTAGKAVNGFIDSVVSTTDTVSKTVSGVMANAIHNDMQQKARDAANIAMVERVSSSGSALSDMFGPTPPIKHAPIPNETAPQYVPKESPKFDYSEIKNIANTIPTETIKAGAAMAGASISIGAMDLPTKLAIGGSVAAQVRTDASIKTDLGNNVSMTVNPFRPSFDKSEAPPIGSNLLNSIGNPKAEASPQADIFKNDSVRAENIAGAKNDVLAAALNVKADAPGQAQSAVGPTLRTETQTPAPRTDAAPAPRNDAAPAPAPGRFDTPAAPSVKAESTALPGRSDAPLPRTEAPISNAPIAKTDAPIGRADTVIGKDGSPISKIDAPAPTKVELPGLRLDGALRSENANKFEIAPIKEAGSPKLDANVHTKVDGQIVAINPLTGRPEIQAIGKTEAVNANAAKVDAQAIINGKLDARQAEIAAGKVPQGRIEIQNAVQNAIGKIMQTSDAAVRGSMDSAVRNNMPNSRVEEQMGNATKSAIINQINQIDGRAASMIPGTNRQDGTRAEGTRSDIVRPDGVRSDVNPTGRNIQQTVTGRVEGQIGQAGIKAGNAAISGALGAGAGLTGDGAGKGAVTGKAIREISGGRYLTGVEIGMLIAAVGIAKARNDARTQAQKPGDASPGKEFNSCKGFLTEKASRINELTMNVRRFPGKEITISAMLAITGAASKNMDHSQGMGNRGLDYTVRIERQIGAAAKASKEDLIAAALSQSSSANGTNMELGPEKKEEEQKQSALDTQLLGFLPSPALWRARRRQELEEQENNDSNSDAINDDISNTNNISGYRRAYRVKANDTLISIAEREYQDANIAWLIADINFDRTTQHEMDGKRVVEVIKGHELQLPLASEIAEFYNLRATCADPDNLITIVVENEINRERLNEDLKDILGLARK